MLTGQQILTVGIVVATAAIVGAAISLIFFVGSGKSLKRKLDEEYGEKRT